MRMISADSLLTIVPVLRSQSAGTVTRPVPAKEVQASRMTMNEFTIQYDRLMSEGKRDEAFALSKKVADKEIKFSR